MTTKHTPGPWKEFHEDDDWWICRVEEGKPTALIVTSTKETTEGDTALICAAPDLLASSEAQSALIRDLGR